MNNISIKSFYPSLVTSAILNYDSHLTFYRDNNYIQVFIKGASSRYIASVRRKVFNILSQDLSNANAYVDMSVHQNVPRRDSSKMAEFIFFRLFG